MGSASSGASCSGGIAVPLTLIFVVLKLVGVIAWSWVWVLSPIWISVLLIIGMLLFTVFIAIILAVLNK